MEFMQIAHRQTAYSLELYRQLLSIERGNTAVSPLSISAALAMLAVGAKGETLDQIVAHLKYPDSNTMHQFCVFMKNGLLKDASHEGGPLVDFATCVLVDKTLPLHWKYQDFVRENYGAEASVVDFQTQAEWTRVQVNMWVKQKTRGKISELFPPNSVNGEMKFLLSNSLYFKGQWEKKFDSSRTRNEPFFLLDGRMVSKPMMTSNEKQYIRNCGTFKVLRLPYKSSTMRNQAFSMFILLPSLIDGLHDLERHLDASAAQWFIEHLPMMRESVPVRRFLLPRFSVSSGFEASSVLNTLGLHLPFDRVRADFSGMFNELSDSFPPLCISKIFHKATVEVDEEGTVAAAATGIGVAFGSAPPSELYEDFVADHPFLFLISEDNTGVIMFIGRVVDP
ncbi:hypothetical protein Mapa_014321 [Marchantia paleacea]|nr:hypothetical protein Mapa_014321 [Marchantia paleacea]